MKKKCKTCGKLFKKRFNVSKKTWNSKTFYCTVKCAAEAWGKKNSGTNHYNWKGGFDYKEYLKAHPEIYEARKERSRQVWKEKRLMVLRFYSKSETPFCNCCKENELIFLAIDHIEEDGASHRRQLATRSRIVDWIIKNNYPKKFQVLCHNCNAAKGISGKCPHKK